MPREQTRETANLPATTVDLSPGDEATITFATGNARYVNRVVLLATRQTFARARIVGKDTTRNVTPQRSVDGAGGASHPDGYPVGVFAGGGSLPVREDILRNERLEIGLTRESSKTTKSRVSVLLSNGETPDAADDAG